MLAEAGERIPAADLRPELHGWRWYVPLPGDRLLLLPVDAGEGARRLARERRLLLALAPRVGFAVPRPLPGPLDIRQRVPGVTGLAEHWARLEDPARALALADDLARVLAELHGALSPDEVLALAGDAVGDPYPMPAERLREIVPSLPAEIQAATSAAIERYAELRPDAPDPVLVHGDLGSHNLAFDPATGRVSGLYDFEESARLDRHRDFKYLPSYGPRVLGRVLELYRERSGVAIDVGVMRLLHLMTALSFWAWREAEPEAHDRLSSRNRDQALAWIGMALFALP